MELIIASNLDAIRQRIDRAARASGRKGSDIKLVAVTKTVGVDRIRQAVSHGITAVGENRVQELVEKYQQLEGLGLEWHMIGHLQTNKVKYIVDKVSLIHSVDRIELVSEIQKRAKAAARKVDVLIQINVSGEQSKFGISVEDALPFVEQVSRYDSLSVKGLMTIAPYAEHPEEIRPVFRRLKEIFERLKETNIAGVSMDYLSMGMTGDFELAIEEGANIVRVGTGIFGERRY
jgi:pyridoxal phosphate enzyme (YggS family)